MGVVKARLPALALLMLGIAAGGFIGLGAMYYTLIVSDPLLSFGWARLLGCWAFSLGLILVVIAGASLFSFGGRYESSQGLCRQREREQEIRDAFVEVLAVRSLGIEAKQLADRYFFETVVRVHRAGEGEPFTGLKAAGSVDPAIAIADRALESDSAAPLVCLRGARG